MAAAFQIVILLYVAGVLVSQSLMSTMGTIILLFGLVFAVSPKNKNFSQSTKILIGLGILSILCEGVHAFILMPYDRGSDVFRSLPLIMLPLAAIIVTYQNFDFHKLFNKQIPYWVTGLSLILLGLCLYQVFFLKVFGYGFFGNPIYFAYAIFPLTLFCMEEFFNKPHLKNFYGWAGFLLLSSLVLSQSRMVLLVMFLYLLFKGLIIFVKSKQHRTKLFIVAGITLAAVILIWWFMPQFREKMMRTFSGKDPSLKWRWVAWSYNWDLFINYPWFGVGPENNGIDVAKMPEMRGEWAPGRLIFAHSIYLQKAAEAGAVGFILFFGYWLFLALRYSETRLFIAALLFAGLTENIFNNSKAAHGIYLAILLSILKPRNLQARGES